MRPIFVVAAIVALAACRSPVEPPALDLEHVIFAPRDPYLRITNGTNSTVYTFVVGRNASALIDWAPCVREDCSPVAAYSSITKSYEDAIIDGSETEALVYWWDAVMVGGERRPGVVRNGVVRVRR